MNFFFSFSKSIMIWFVYKGWKLRNIHRESLSGCVSQWWHQAWCKQLRLRAFPSCWQTHWLALSIRDFLKTYLSNVLKDLPPREIQLMAKTTSFLFVAVLLALWLVMFNIWLFKGIQFQIFLQNQLFWLLFKTRASDLTHLKSFASFFFATFCQR